MRKPINTILTLGDYSFLSNLILNADEVSIFCEGTAKLQLPSITSDKTRLIGSELSVTMGEFSGDVYLEQGAYLYNCFIEGILFVDKLSSHSSHYPNTQSKQILFSEDTLDKDRSQDE